MPYLERPGAEIYYDVVGEGPPVVFAHGLGGTPVSWWQQVPELAGRWKCVVFAARGFHPSRLSRPLPADPSVVTEFVEDLSALIEHLELDRVRLVAQSLGGWTCLEYTLAHPDRVAALVLADTTGTVRPAVDTTRPTPSACSARGSIRPAASACSGSSRGCTGCTDPSTISALGSTSDRWWAPWRRRAPGRLRTWSGWTCPCSESPAPRTW
ncbi:MAG TPA: alpha/beta hydrolase [Acidimicrobiales bacterium]|nr:alpha/beta hydrolase [Acidimicrobiales bacterium]